MTKSSNPFRGRTLRAPRPTSEQAEFVELTDIELLGVQHQWDSAEKERLAEIAAEAQRAELLQYFETREEPITKALENRLRIAYLATKGATMQMWLEQREAILANHAGATAGPDK